MPFCSECGKSVNENDKFCRSCGASQNITPAVSQPEPVATATISSQPVPTPQVASSGEQVIGIIVLRKPKSLGRYDTYTGVVTNNRFIFAQMTSQMVTDAAMQARNQAKAEGKGFFGQWGDQLKATSSYTQRYLSMNPENILVETPGKLCSHQQHHPRIKT